MVYMEKIVDENKRIWKRQRHGWSTNYHKGETMLSYIILGVLTENEMSGYDLKKHIDKNFSLFYKVSYGALYPTLRKLSDKELIRNDTTGERNKKIYSITQRGSDDFDVWLSSAINIDDNMNSNLAKIFFYDKLPEQKANELLLDFEKNISDKLDVLLEKKNALKNYIDENNYFKFSTLYYGISTLEEMKNWCKFIRNKNKLF